MTITEVRQLAAGWKTSRQAFQLFDKGTRPGAFNGCRRMILAAVQGIPGMCVQYSSFYILQKATFPSCDEKKGV